MNDDAATAPTAGQRTAAAFEQYVSGRRAIDEGTVFFLEAREHLDEVRRIADEADVLIVPGSTDTSSAPAVIGYSGRFLEQGDEMTLDGRHTFELQDYLAAPFLSIVGLTVVRQGSAEGVAAFLQDADSARESGVFVDQLLSSAVLLDSRSAFTAVRPEPGVVRVHVSADGEYRDGADGMLLGRLGDDRRHLDATGRLGAWRGRGLARVVDRAAFDAALDGRPWLARYVAAIDLLRTWQGGGAAPSISGFGGHLVSALDSAAPLAAVHAVAAPFLLTGTDDGFVLVDPTSRRRFRLGTDAARAAESLIATGDEGLATALLADDLATTSVAAADMIRQVRDRFVAAGVDLTVHAGVDA